MVRICDANSDSLGSASMERAEAITQSGSMVPSSAWVCAMATNVAAEVSSVTALPSLLRYQERVSLIVRLAEEV